MEFVNEFTVPTDVDTAWEVLTDLERVAPCLPGASLEAVEGTTHRGTVKIKLGPVTMTYKGTAELVEADAEAKVARIDAKGREARGSGTAAADVTASLSSTAGGTKVHVVTNLDVTGKPAQFGRGMMEDVGSRIIDEFSRRLERLVQGDEDTAAAPAPATSDAASGEAATGPRPVATPAPAPAGSPAASGDDDVLDLFDVAGAATAKRVVPIVAAIAVVVFLLRRFARR